MSPIAWIPLVLALPTAAVSQPADSAPATEQIVVLPFGVDQSIDPKAALLIDEVFLSELAALKPATVRLVGSNDVAAVLGFEQQKQLAGCNDASCLIEVGNALGAGQVIAPTLGKLGDQYLVGAKLLTTRDASVLFRKVLYTEATEKPMLLGVRQLAGELAVSQGWTTSDRIATVAAPTIGAASQPAEPGNPALLWSAIGLTGGGVLLAASAGGTALGLDALVVGQSSTDWSMRQGTAPLVLGLAGASALGLALAAVGGVLFAIWAL